MAELSTPGHGAAARNGRAGPETGTAQTGGAWAGVCAVPVPGRQAKPRERGLTMVIDKGLGVAATADLLELAAPCIDLLKFAFGTTAFYSEDVLARKLRLAEAAGVLVYPGGTFLEVAVAQGRGAAFLQRAEALGFRAIEISDGTIPMDTATRYALLEEALRLGLRVLTEVGKKHPDDRLPSATRQAQIAADLRHGAWKVIVEGRESGKGVGMYRADGSIDTSEMEGLAQAAPDVADLIWEAPLKQQQQELILQFGCNVNLGNIAAAEALSLEALRVGLRGDTLRAALGAGAPGALVGAGARGAQ